MATEVVKVNLKVLVYRDIRRLETHTLLHLKVLLASPGIAVAKPSTQGV